MKELIDEKYVVQHLVGINQWFELGGGVNFGTRFEARESMKRWQKYEPLVKFRIVKRVTTDEVVEL